MMPLMSTQEQLDIERSIVDQNSQVMSEQLRAGIFPEAVDDKQGWQTVTPKKSRKKAKRATKKLQDSNKKPHSDSLIKEWSPKRQAINPLSMHSDNKNGANAAPPCPSLTLSLSHIDCDGTDMRKISLRKQETTPLFWHPEQGQMDAEREKTRKLNQDEA